ncbi:arginase family protein [Cryptosporangium aurantiacum]|uniref:Arginase n=1 Tax=Cryptosporangium aurantiacum TaxID=134849 RepID=A0A1M7QGQ1_9ACTN|nr:arginase family protein [Cryptosporangium aurantiacum]SHN29871.1 arginase [Cryptosporangium aurantiacum]
MAFSVLGAPTTAGSHNAGQETAPRVLREAGLLDALKARGLDVHDAGDTPPMAYQPQGVGVVARDLARVTEQAAAVARGVAAIAREGRVPLVLGGDCSIEVGVVAGLIDAGRDPVLAYFDGDLDLSTPADSTSGVLDSMVLAHLLGLADTGLSRLGPRFPLLAPDRVLAVGFHPVEASPAHHAWLKSSAVTALPVTELDGTASQIRAAVDPLAARGPVLVHFDVDVIDSGDFPLANFPHFNGGLTADAAFAVLGALCDVPDLAAVVVTEVNPNNDVDGTLIRRLVNGLVDALS